MNRLVATLPPGTDVRLGQDATVHVDDSEPVPATVIGAELAEDGFSVKVTVGMDRMPLISSFSRLSISVEPGTHAV